jgi:hypothetical protein
MEGYIYNTFDVIGVLHITGLYMLRRLTAAWAPVCLGHSAALHSHGKPPPHFVGPGLCCTKPLFGPPKRHIAPERYAKYAPIF